MVLAVVVSDTPLRACGNMARGGVEGGWKGGGSMEGKGDGMERKAANGIAREGNDDV